MSPSQRSLRPIARAGALMLALHHANIHLDAGHAVRKVIWLPCPLSLWTSTIPTRKRSPAFVTSRFPLQWLSTVDTACTFTTCYGNQANIGPVQMLSCAVWRYSWAAMKCFPSPRVCVYPALTTQNAHLI